MLKLGYNGSKNATHKFVVELKKLMKYQILFFWLPSVAFSSERVPLYAQLCLPYVENNQGFFNCGEQNEFELELQETDDPEYFVGEWFKLVNMDEAKYKAT